MYPWNILCNGHACLSDHDLHDQLDRSDACIVLYGRIAHFNEQLHDDQLLDEHSNQCSNRHLHGAIRNLVEQLHDHHLSGTPHHLQRSSRQLHATNRIDGKQWFDTHLQYGDHDQCRCRLLYPANGIVEQQLPRPHLYRPDDHQRPDGHRQLHSGRSNRE